jgi:NAD(P)-dependent dehydrogenase (short-subunit alcohol dehydrogenase family)
MTPTGLKILILGGYGTFGGRLAQLLADDDRLTLIIAGRSRAKAQAFCATLPSTAVPAVFDRDANVERQLHAIAPDLIVDASGPFQGYGADPYRVVKASLTLGIHYLDLADGAEFVQRIAQFDALARARGVFVLAGVSSFPVLTAAAVRMLAQGMARIEQVTGGIAPSPFARVGMNVIRAIASYGGKPITMIRDGRITTGYALIDSRRFIIAPPGRMPLDPIRFSLVDAPEFRLLPVLWPGLRSVWMGVGPVPAIWHWLLTGLAWLVRLRLLPSLSSLPR